MSLTETITAYGKVVLTRDELTPPLTRASTPTPSLLVAPLAPSAATYDTDVLTPAIGIKINLSLKQILAFPEAKRDATIRDLAILSESPASPSSLLSESVHVFFFVEEVSTAPILQMLCASLRHSVRLGAVTGERWEAIRRGESL